MSDLIPCHFCGKTPTIEHNGGSFGYTPPSIFIKCCNGIMIKEFTQAYDWEKKKYDNVIVPATLTIINKWNTRAGIDYKSLLEKYMVDVLLTEGTDFVDNIQPSDPYSEAEVKELNRISAININLNKL